MQITRQELTEHTIAIWQPRIRRHLSAEDAREITENINGFFTILAEWSSQEVSDGSDPNNSGGLAT